MPVLANVLLSGRGRTRSASPRRDLYLSLIPAGSPRKSRRAAAGGPAKDLFERVKMMPDGPIVITSQDNATTTSRPGYRAPVHPPRHAGRRFPPLPQPAEGLADPRSTSRSSQSSSADAFLDFTDETRAPEQRALSSGKATSFEWSRPTVTASKVE